MSLNPPPEDETSRRHWWWRPGWGPGTRCWTLHIVFGAQPGRSSLLEAVDALEQVRGLPGWDAVPRRWLHLTMQGVGFADQLDAEEVAAVAQAAGRALAGTGPLVLELGPPLIDAEGVNLPAAHPRLDGVRLRVREVLAQVLGKHRVEESAGWRPHVTMAYAAQDGAALAPVRALLAKAPVRALVEVDHVSLIRLHRDRGVYEWDEEIRVPLA
ncbi:2'-5' RNA ligase family protein [Nocardiopsis sp. NPDC006198]|uniref:2'-5' RNA ligase family protein n=1 Tax=Nocardiopsis sp. NPDC006198 TaxID=3154472 RepID=UPI0033A2DB4F